MVALIKRNVTIKSIKLDDGEIRQEMGKDNAEVLSGVPAGWRLPLSKGQ